MGAYSGRLDQREIASATTSAASVPQVTRQVLTRPHARSHYLLLASGLEA